MFTLKNKYFLIIKSIKDIDLKNIKIRSKFSIIYRNQSNVESKVHLLRFRRNCKIKSIKFYVANNIELAIDLRSDGIYLSAFNKSLKALSFKKNNLKIIGSAHNLKEIWMKTKQGCDLILYSKLFLVSYDNKAPYLGVIKFNNFLKINKNLIPLGGINLNNLNSLKYVNSDGFALMSEAKKKPAKIFSRLF
jgi:thiamine-phosphate pyrophosphorylase